MKELAILCILLLESVSWLSQYGSATDPAHITVGVLLSYDGRYGYKLARPIIEYATKKAGKKYLPNTTFSIQYRDSTVYVKQGMGLAYELYYNQQVDLLLGLYRSAVAETVGLMSNKWNLPIYTVATSSVLRDIYRYKTVVRTSCSAEWFGTALVRLFDYAKMLASSIRNSFSSCGISLTTSRIWVDQEYTKYDVMPDIMYHLNRLKDRTRVVLLCGPDKFIHDVITAAYKLDMINGSMGEFMYVAVSILRPEHVLRPWAAADLDLNPELRFMYQNVLQLTSALPDNTTVMKELLEKIGGMPQEDTDPENIELSGSLESLVYYDTIFYYMQQVRTLIDSGRNYKDGVGHLQLAINDVVFAGITGRFVMNYHAERQCDYEVWRLQSESENYRPVFMFMMSEAYINATVCTSWLMPSSAGRSHSIPTMNFAPNKPKCGYSGEDCTDTSTVVRTAVITSCVLFTCLLIGCILFGLLFRRVRHERERLQLAWKIDCDELVFATEKYRPQSLADDVQQLKTKFSEELQIPKKRLTFSMTTLEHLEIGQSQMLFVADYHGNPVMLRQLPVQYTFFSQEELLELKELKDLNHENLDKFYGVCLKSNVIMFVSSFCDRGTLQDVLLNENLKLDDTFKRSFIREIIKGMKFLHKSPVKVHGRLKSSCCLLDSRWTLKISNFGLAAYRVTHFETEHETYTDLLWTAPELLRHQFVEHQPFIAGTQPGDVYSFAIIMHEILYQTGPYASESESRLAAKTIVQHLTKGETPPFRPTVIPSEVSKILINLMIKCWDETPNARPDFNEIYSIFSSMKKHHVNIIDNVIKMMEDYHMNLEELIEQRAQQLTDNIKKTTNLLYEMMPKAVVDRLVSGERSFSDNYLEAAVFFSGVSGFSQISRSWSPLDIVLLLDRLFKKLDEVVIRYQVYKVETVEDTYVVGSGVPRPYPKHNVEIANMALAMRNAVADFRMPELNNRRILIQIGLHCGPLAAGVIGSVRPRYCLFGDTVNMASRMMSTGVAMHIQLSQPMYEALANSKQNFYMTERGSFGVKGKGIQTTYFLEGRKGTSWFSEYP